jgi:hypothetical protein
MLYSFLLGRPDRAIKRNAVRWREKWIETLTHNPDANIMPGEKFFI